MLCHTGSTFSAYTWTLLYRSTRLIKKKHRLKLQVTLFVVAATSPHLSCRGVNLEGNLLIAQISYKIDLSGGLPAYGSFMEFGRPFIFVIPLNPIGYWNKSQMTGN